MSHHQLADERASLLLIAGVSTCIRGRQLIHVHAAEQLRPALPTTAMHLDGTVRRRQDQAR